MLSYTPEFIKHINKCEKYKRKKWYQFWVKKPKPFTNYIFCIDKEHSDAIPFWLYAC